MRRELLHTALLGLSVAMLSLLGSAARGEDAYNRTHGSIQNCARCHTGAALEEETKGKVWIGVFCDLPDAALRAQLKLPEKSGLLVSRVLEDGPAASAGVQQHDVLLTADDKPLGEVADLIAAIQAAGDREIKFTLLHGGERKEVSVQPKVNPSHKSDDAPNSGQSISWNILRPGQVLAPGTKFTLKLPNFELPDDTTVVITRHAKDKATIRVQQNDKSWELTEDKLGELPPEIRGPVEAMTRPFAFPAGAPAPSGDMLFIAPSPSASQDAINKSLEFLQQQAKAHGGDVAYRKALAEALQLKNRAEVAYQQAVIQALDARNVAIKMADLETQKLTKKLQEKVRPQVESAVEGARQWSLEQLDTRFDQLQQQLDELRQAVKQARAEAKPAPKAEATPGDAAAEPKP